MAKAKTPRGKTTEAKPKKSTENQAQGNGSEVKAQAPEGKVPEVKTAAANKPEAVHEPAKENTNAPATQAAPGPVMVASKPVAQKESTQAVAKESGTLATRAPEPKSEAEKVNEIKTPLPSAAQDLEAAIRQRAYDIYVQRGRTPGNPMEDWARAEREVLQSFGHQRSA